MPEMMMSSPEDPRIRTLEEKLSEMEDYQLLNKLDIIAIKEQMEHIEKMSNALTPETQQRLAWVEQITKSDKFQSIEKLIDEVHNIESALEQAKTGLSAEQVENLKNEISDKVSQDVSSLRQKLDAAPMGKIAVPVPAQFDSSALESEIRNLKAKISALETSRTGPAPEAAKMGNDITNLQNRLNDMPQSLTQTDREAIMQDIEARLQATTNKIYAELRSSMQAAGKTASDNLHTENDAVNAVKGEIESSKSEIKSELEAKFADLETRLKPMESYPDFRNELRAEMDKISDVTMRGLNEKMNQIQEAMSKSGMEDTKREIYEDFHKFKISIIDQISKSADDVEAKVMPQIASWRSEADKALQRNKDAYNELVKFKISTMDEVNKKSKEIKDSVMIQVPAEIHTMRADVDNKLQKFESQIAEIKMLKSDVEDFRKKLERSKVGELDKVAGDVERVKARTEWLEDELLKKDITAINERISELETEIKRTKAMVPVVLE
ncbi:MAG: hypothetical protein HY516_04255 [Candidatus Aenigmarchaeota archaeon]|nr:hypothetical protein [Candidatus Aenigmarchaeota archaeon]